MWVRYPTPTQGKTATELQHHLYNVTEAFMTLAIQTDKINILIYNIYTSARGLFLLEIR